MKNSFTYAALAALLLTLIAFPSNSMAQLFGGMASASTKGLAIAGKAELKKQPDKVRMCIEIMAKGKNLEDALKNLEKQVKKAKKKVAKLKPIKDSIQIGIPQLSTLKNDLQKQMGGSGSMAYATPMSPSTRKPPKGLKKTEITTAKALLRADWELDVETPAERLLFVDELKGEIKKADVSGQKDFRKLSPEEEELMAEANARQSEYSHFGSNEEKVEPGTPTFFYIATISEKERKKLLREAFEEAQKKGKDLSDLAGIPFGKMVSLSSRTYTGTSEVHEMYGMGYESHQARGNFVRESLGDNEAIHSKCGPIKFNASVQTVFEIK